MKKINIVSIFDIDGVLLDSTHRYEIITCRGKSKINLQHWRENENKCIHDVPLPMADYYGKMLKRKNAFVIIATSRVMSALDYQVIESKLGKPHAIVSRINNEQKGGLLKFNGCLHIFEQLNLKPREVQIFEDNIDYLKFLADGFTNKGYNVTARYITSNQGH